jgi:ferritin
MHDDVQSAITHQINMEFTAAYRYLGLAAYFHAESLDGFAHWMEVQHDEEVQHAMRLFRYLLDRGGSIDLAAIPKPGTPYDSIISAFEAALEQEQHNTRSINKLYALASEHQDFATKSHLQWFLDEQVEEEKNIGDLLNLLRRTEGDQSALLYLNDKLAARSIADEAE